MTNKTTAILLALAAMAISGALYSSNAGRTPVEFYKGHTHVDGDTQGAPEHSGGTNSAGCHNASVPYHCH